jgi:hypothetical protein
MIGGFSDLETLVLRLETIYSFGVGNHSLGVGSGTISCGPLDSNDAS